MGLAEDMRMIKDAELDIELLYRDNDKKCAENNEEIKNLKEKIGSTEFIIKEELKASGEDKLECKFDGYKGSTVFKKQPDEWKYDEDILLDWITSVLPVKIKELFLKVVTTFKKGDLKKQIIDYNDGLFKDGKIREEYLDTDVTGCELLLHTKEKDYKIPGIKIKHQDPKFSYTIKKIK